MKTGAFYFQILLIIVDAFLRMYYTDIFEFDIQGGNVEGNMRIKVEFILIRCDLY